LSGELAWEIRIAWQCAEVLTAAHRGEPITCGVCSAVVAVDDTRRGGGPVRPGPLRRHPGPFDLVAQRVDRFCTCCSVFARTHDEPAEPRRGISAMGGRLSSGTNLVVFAVGDLLGAVGDLPQLRAVKLSAAAAGWLE
jgi:hypothetical protein